MDRSIYLSIYLMPNCGQAQTTQGAAVSELTKEPSPRRYPSLIFFRGSLPWCGCWIWGLTVGILQFLKRCRRCGNPFTTSSLLQSRLHFICSLLIKCNILVTGLRGLQSFQLPGSSANAVGARHCHSESLSPACCLRAEATRAPEGSRRGPGITGRCCPKSDFLFGQLAAGGNLGQGRNQIERPLALGRVPTIGSIAFGIQRQRSPHQVPTLSLFSSRLSFSELDCHCWPANFAHRPPALKARSLSHLSSDSCKQSLKKGLLFLCAEDTNVLDPSLVSQFWALGSAVARAFEA